MLRRYNSKNDVQRLGLCTQNNQLLKNNVQSQWQPLARFTANIAVETVKTHRRVMWANDKLTRTAPPS